MKPEEYTERDLEIDGWPVHLATYKLDGTWHTRADNVSPGAGLARTTGATREESENKALDRARELLSRTRRHSV